MPVVNGSFTFVDGGEIINVELENLATDPTGGALRAGRIWHNTTDNLSKYYDGTAIQPFPAGATSTDVTITESATTHTVAVGGGTTDVINLADGTNSGLLAPADKTKLDTVETNAAADQNASEVPSTASGNLAATNVQAALDELQGDIDALTTSNAADNFISTAGTPAAGDGIDGDYHLNVANGDITGPKAGGAWPGNGNVGNAFSQIGLADATAADTTAGAGGTATTAARSDHSHARDGFNATFGDGSTGPFAIAHGLGTDNIIVDISDSATGAPIIVDYVRDATNVTVSPLAAVAAGAYTINVRASS